MCGWRILTLEWGNSAELLPHARPFRAYLDMLRPNWKGCLLAKLVELAELDIELEIQAATGLWKASPWRNSFCLRTSTPSTWPDKDDSWWFTTREATSSSCTLVRNVACTMTHPIVRVVKLISTTCWHKCYELLRCYPGEFFRLFPSQISMMNSQNMPEWYCKELCVKIGVKIGLFISFRPNASTYRVQVPERSYFSKTGGSTPRLFYASQCIAYLKI